MSSRAPKYVKKDKSVPLNICPDSHALRGQFIIEPDLSTHVNLTAGDVRLLVDVTVF